ncbi:MAG: hypothetical protein JNL84_04960 [Candidatus Accumulibacter sp.]|nr:hypothetical protein [Accumulibacter sp.]
MPVEFEMDRCAAANLSIVKSQEETCSRKVFHQCGEHDGNQRFLYHPIVFLHDFNRKSINHKLMYMKFVVFDPVGEKTVSIG